jgi:cysteinyl-tRNA synthetase
MNSKIHLYNTLTRQKEEFQPINPGEVRMYSCGPTVYDSAHIGNLRSYIFADTLKRMFKFNNYSVIQAMNITDVGHLVGDGDEGEDKLEVGAKREGVDPLAIARKYTEQFINDLKALNIELPDKIKSATEAIEGQIEIIKLLEQKGFAYKTSAAVYFDTAKVVDYGKLTGQRREDMLAGARDEVIVDTEKRNPQDFALWFFLVGRYESHILHWPSPWGEGFPGWHIECSAISRELLGQPFDIHTGGVDHIGTHHTNEIAQSEAAFGTPLANYWLHNEFLMVNGEKMAKSKGNLYILNDLTDKGFSPLDFRYLCLMANYRSKMNFTWDALEGAKNTLQGIRNLIRETKNEENGENKAIENALVDDLDLPKALALLHEAKNPELWRTYDSFLGLKLDLNKTIELISKEASDIKALYDRARREQDYTTSDRLRNQLIEMGYEVRDESNQSQIRRIN